MNLRDRVRFTLSDVDRNHVANARAAQRAFGMTCSEAYSAVKHEKTIICRPSQFARFLIYRSEDVDGNRLKQLNAQLIPSPQHEPVLDVTNR